MSTDTKFIFAVNEDLLSLITDFCNTQGSHLTFFCIKHKVYLAAICPEYFKLFDTGQAVDCDDFAIRIPKHIVRPIIADCCTLMFILSEKITIRKYKDSDKILASVVLPLEYDFNDTLIKETLRLGEECENKTDLSDILSLKPLVPFSTDGIQCKDNMAYVMGNGFQAYLPVKSPINFVLTQKNMAELSSFIRTHHEIFMYEYEVYVLFKSDKYYFGCKQPVRFVNSNYNLFLKAKPITQVKCNLTEICRIVYYFTIPKSEIPICNFNLSKGIISISSDYDYMIAMECDKHEDITFQIPLDVIKRIFTNSKIKYSDITLAVYESFICIRSGSLDILISRGD